jgi:hypothetical protein
LYPAKAIGGDVLFNEKLGSETPQAQETTAINKLVCRVSFIVCRTPELDCFAARLQAAPIGHTFHLTAGFKMQPCISAQHDAQHMNNAFNMKRQVMQK